MASDNKILTSDLFHTVLFMWRTPYNYIRDSVRTQKVMCEFISWDRRDLEGVLKQRIKVHTSKLYQGEVDLLEECSEESRNLIFSMCNKNPRDLWHLLNFALREQFRLDENSKISDDAISSAVKRFVAEFNYFEYYPRRSNARSNTMDIYKYIKHLLKLDTVKFTKDKLSTMAGTGGATNNYVVAMENMGLIANSNEKAQGGAVVYQIQDPKVCYALENGLAIAEK